MPRLLFSLFLSLALLRLADSAELQPFAECEWVDRAWADGDSFHVAFPDGSSRTVRLYGADCIEALVNDSTDARRLRAQRRYFGISGYGGSPRSSIDLAKGLGEKATETTRALLAERFTVHTAFADGGGSGRYKRYYAFVETAGGDDLATLLVERGLARAYGVYRTTPSGIPRDEYRERLKDAELVAARKGVGAWAFTDWEQLPRERREERMETIEALIAMGRAAPVEPVGLNSGSSENLERSPGIGPVLAERIIAGRPYADVEALLGVPGIGPATLDAIKDYVDLD